jgi:hypothetical protein
MGSGSMRIGEAMNSDGACSEPAAEHARALIVNFRLGADVRIWRANVGGRRNRPVSAGRVRPTSGASADATAMAAAEPDAAR